VVSCWWSVVGGQLSVVGGQLSVVGGQLSVVGGQLSVVGGQLLVVRGGRIFFVIFSRLSAPCLLIFPCVVGTANQRTRTDMIKTHILGYITQFCKFRRCPIFLNRQMFQRRTHILTNGKAIAFHRA